VAIATDENRVEGSALRIDTGKFRLDLLDPQFMRGVADALEYGTVKYEEWDWLKGWAWNRPYASIQRHLLSFAERDEYDAETLAVLTEHAEDNPVAAELLARWPQGLPHLYMAACQMMFLTHMVEYSDKYGHLDNRPDFETVKVARSA
jgi:hypothetical protein